MVVAIHELLLPNPNESESVARMVYPPPKSDHKGSALQFFAKNVKMFFVSTYCY